MNLPMPVILTHRCHDMRSNLCGYRAVANRREIVLGLSCVKCEATRKEAYTKETKYSMGHDNLI